MLERQDEALPSGGSSPVASNHRRSLTFSLVGILLLIGMLLGWTLTLAWADHPPAYATGSGGDQYRTYLPVIGKGYDPTPPDATATDTPTASVSPTTTPRVSLTPTPTFSPTPTPTPTASGHELLVFNWNGPVPKEHHGMPSHLPPWHEANGSWISPINYAGGTLHFRAEIFDQPVAQNMNLQFCFWQFDGSRLECGPQRYVPGNPGNVATWSQRVQDMWTQGAPINWAVPRDQTGIVIKNLAGQPVSDLEGWDWNGEDPDAWYPLDMSFMVVVVEAGAVFSGWESYIGLPPQPTTVVRHTPSVTPTPSITPTPTPSPTLFPGEELVVFDWNKPVTKADHGFPWDYPPMASANGNWTQPTNFAEGTLHFRAEIRSQPVAQDMRLQFCFWQYGTSREECGTVAQVMGNPGNIVTWSCNMEDMWKLDEEINWADARDRNGAAIKTNTELPVSDYAGWNWNGENPDRWYPLDMRFTVVVVEKGAAFSGWGNYTGPATPTPSLTPTKTTTPTTTNTNEPSPTSTVTPSTTVSPTPTGTGTSTPTSTPTGTGTSTFTPTPTDTGTPTMTLTPTNTNTPVPGPTETFTPTPTATDTHTPTPTPTYTDTPTP